MPKRDLLTQSIRPGFCDDGSRNQTAISTFSKRIHLTFHLIYIYVLRFRKEKAEKGIITPTIFSIDLIPARIGNTCHVCSKEDIRTKID